MARLTTLHPIALDDQKYIIPSNAEIGDNAGKVNYLWSHPYFANRKWPPPRQQFFFDTISTV
tara:strand:+ start:138 stop:323 length:186 start_codon:yes stop_codon:yes gene_type:complete